MHFPVLLVFFVLLYVERYFIVLTLTSTPFLQTVIIFIRQIIVTTVFGKSHRDNVCLTPKLSERTYQIKKGCPARQFEPTAYFGPKIPPIWPLNSRGKLRKSPVES